MQWANQSTYEFYKEHCNEVDRKLELMARITMKTKGSHGGHGFSLIDNTERRNDDDDQMMNQARTGNRNMDMATDMEVVRAATVETLAVGAMLETVAEVVSKMVAMVATDEVARWKSWRWWPRRRWLRWTWCRLTEECIYLYEI